MKQLQPPDISSVLSLIEAHMKYKHLNGPPRGFEIFHPSAFGACLRRMQYQRYAENNVSGLKMPESNADGNLIRIFDNGHTIHDKWASYWEDIGILKGVWQCSNPLCYIFDDNGSLKEDIKINENTYEDLNTRVYGKKKLKGVFKPEKCKCGNTDFIYHEVSVKDKDLNISGHADLILNFQHLDVDKYEDIGIGIADDNFPENDIVVDMKTTNSRKFRAVMNDGPPLSYRVQLTIYANLLDCEYGVLIYENKDNSKIAAFKIERSEDDIWPIIKKQSKLMQKMYDKQMLPPPRPDSKQDYECRYCEFKDICHSSDIWDDPDLDKKREKFYRKLL